MTSSIRPACAGGLPRPLASGLAASRCGARQRQLLGVRAHGSLSGSLSGSMDFDEAPAASAGAAALAAAAVERLVLSAATTQQLSPTASAWLAEHQDAVAPAAAGDEEGADGAAGSFFSRLLDLIPLSPRTRGIVMLNLLVLLVASNWVSWPRTPCAFGLPWVGFRDEEWCAPGWLKSEGLPAASLPATPPPPLTPRLRHCVTPVAASLPATPPPPLTPRLRHCVTPVGADGRAAC